MEDKEIIKNCLYKLEKKLLQTNTHQFSLEITDLLSEEFVEFGSSGSIYNKKQVIEYLKQDTGYTTNIENFDINILTENVILATYKAEKYNCHKGDRIKSLRSSLWKFSNNRWQLIFHQGTPLKNN